VDRIAERDCPSAATLADYAIVFPAADGDIGVAAPFPQFPRDLRFLTHARCELVAVYSVAGIVHGIGDVVFLFWGRIVDGHGEVP
jgi:hypothetical protein